MYLNLQTISSIDYRRIMQETDNSYLQGGDLNGKGTEIEGIYFHVDILPVKK